MFRLLFYMIIGILCNQLNAQSKGGIEQYNYLNNSGVSSIMPVVHFETRKGWYSEARYNYEELKTFSFYLGKSFSNDAFFSWSVTPMVGCVIGNLKGVSTAMNLDFECDNIFLSSQPQFVVAMDKVNENFFYNWIDLGYNIRKWIYAGITMQQKIAGSGNQTENGLMVGFNIKRFTFPVYFFNPARQDTYFILGINWEWK